MSGESSTSSGAVFLSYASQDADAAKRICEALRAVGIEVWFDQSELRGGDAWDRHIHKQIHDCRLLIALISSNTEARDEGYFRREWRLAIDRTLDMDENKTFLVPVAIDNTSERSAAVPEALHRVQWARLPGGHPTSAFVGHVVRLLGIPAPIAGRPDSSPATAETAPLRRRRSKTALLLAGACLALIAGGWIAWHQHWMLGSVGTAEAGEQSIAVLPFVDLSERHDQQYFGDGLAEEILNVLGTIPGLKVIGRGSSFHFRGSDLDLRRVGERLGARYLVEGSVRTSGSQLKVTAQLIDATDGSSRWSDTYQPSPADVLTLQRTIALAVARALRMTVLDYFSGRGTHSEEAHDLYLRGIRDTDTGNPEAVRRSATELTRAVEIDPTYVDGWVGLANAYDNMATMGLAPAAETYRQARHAIDKALELDPKNADAYSVRAFVRMNEYDWRGADADIRQSLALRKSVNAIEAVSKLAAARGNLTRAISTLEEVLATDPLDLYALGLLSYPLYPAVGRYTDAERAAEKIRAINPGSQYLNVIQAFNALMLGNRERALRMADAEPDPVAKQATLAQIYAASGKKGSSDEALKLLLANPATTSDWLASVYAFRGELDQAFQQLDKAYDQRSPALLYLQSDPTFANLRRDPRYAALLRKMHLVE
jgi:TolB-like protein